MCILAKKVQFEVLPSVNKFIHCLPEVHSLTDPLAKNELINTGIVRARARAAVMSSERELMAINRLQE